jgi:hypothetical protein
MAKHVLKVILPDCEMRQEIIDRNGRLKVARLSLTLTVYIRNIYRSSGASKVNPVYGKTRVKSDFARSRDATGFYGG